MISTPYDDVFRTLLNDCPKLIIPIINEIFKEHYSGTEEIQFFPNEHFLNKQDGKEEEYGGYIMERNVNIIDDMDGGKIVVINDIAFKGRQKIEWPEVEKYLKQFVGEYYSIIETRDMIYIGSDLPDEFTGSNYTKKLKGALAKAKANATQGLPELIEIASKKRFKENLKEKHDSDAKYGWYRYDTKFALPVYNENQELERFNVFQAVLLIRYAQDGKLYLYDLINIKKETGKPLEQ